LALSRHETVAVVSTYYANATVSTATEKWTPTSLVYRGRNVGNWSGLAPTYAGQACTIRVTAIVTSSGVTGAAPSITSSTCSVEAVFLANGAWTRGVAYRVETDGSKTPLAGAWTESYGMWPRLNGVTCLMPVVTTASATCVAKASLAPFYWLGTSIWAGGQVQGAWEYPEWGNRECLVLIDKTLTDPWLSVTYRQPGAFNSTCYAEASLNSDGSWQGEMLGTTTTPVSDRWELSLSVYGFAPALNGAACRLVATPGHY
jgi:hypothetical protein